MNLKENKMNLKEKLLAGQKVYGIMLRLNRDPGILHLVKNTGLDFVMYDCEHSSYNFETLQDLFVCGNAMGLPGLVRVPELSKGYLSRFLDFGAGGVMLPMTSTAADAKELVRLTKYAPVGERGYAASSAHTGFKGSAKPLELMACANNRILTIAQIETKQAIDNAQEIAATSGIDVLLIGPNDLALSLGVPGDLTSPIVLEAISHVAAACKKQGRIFGIHGGVNLLKLFKDDLALVMSETDTSVLEKGLNSLREAMHNL